MSVTIVGCGGIGLLLAASLIEGGEEVFLLERTPRRAAALQTILREGAEGKKRFPVRAFGDPNDLPPTEWIVVAVKAYDTEGAVRGIADLAHAARATIVLQNGLPRYDVLAAYLPRWLVGVTYQGATRKGTGHVLHAGRGETILGAVGGSAQEDCAEAAAEVFRRGGWPTRVSPRIEGEIWTKILVNAAINPLTAILRVENGALPDRPDAERLIAGIVAEGMRVVEAAGIPLTEPDLPTRIDKVCRKTARNRSSMLQDILAGRPTEIDALNGAIVQEGSRYGIETPINATLVALVHLLEAKHPMRAAIGIGQGPDSCGIRRPTEEKGESKGKGIQKGKEEEPEVT